MPHIMAPLHVLLWEQEHVTHTRLKLNFYTHKPSFQSYTTCEVILIQPRICHQCSLRLGAEFEWRVKQFLSNSGHL